MVTSVVEAVERELARLHKRGAVDLADSAMAAAALALALEIDTGGNSATSKSMCAKELRETLSALWAAAPPEEAMDDLDELAQRRASRRATA